MGYCCRNDISLLPWSHHTAKQTGPDDEIPTPPACQCTELVVCLDCGTTEFAVPEAELRILAKDDAAAAG